MANKATKKEERTKQEQDAKSSIEQEAIRIVNQEKATWDTATAFITERVAFQMRNLIRLLRKNYWGIFDEPVDPTTGRKKIWIPLTETAISDVVKNIDLDTKDINFRSKKKSSIVGTSIVRTMVKNKLDEIFFGQTLDDTEYDLARDGTVVWKTFEGYDEILKKKTMIRKTVDLLNVYIDPTAESIQTAYRFTERALLFESEVKGMNGWLNTDGIQGSFNLARTDETIGNNLGNSSMAGSKMVDVYEMWGKIPKYLITGKDEDRKEEVDGHIIVSGLDRPGKERCHLIEENKKGIKPYEECWYTRVSGRWYGRGIAEKLMFLQIYINTIVNIRINRSYVSQLGIFKIKRGRGITPQMIGRLSTNGAILVQDQTDIEQMAIKEASESSYSDEQNIIEWGRKLTSAYPSVTGEKLPSQRSATAASIQTTAATSEFVMIKNNLAGFLQRWLKRHAIPILLKDLTKEEVVRMTGSIEELRAFDEQMVNQRLLEIIATANKNGIFLNPEQVAKERERYISGLSKVGKDRFITLKDAVEILDYDVEVFVTNEEMDKGVMVTNLNNILNSQAFAQAGISTAPVVQAIMDLMGLDAYQFKQEQIQQSNPQQIQPQGQPTQPMPQMQQMQPTQSPAEMMQQANTM